MPKEIITEVTTAEVEAYFVDAFAREKQMNPQVVRILFELWFDRERAHATAAHGRMTVVEALRTMSTEIKSTRLRDGDPLRVVNTEWLDKVTDTLTEQGVVAHCDLCRRSHITEARTTEGGE